MQQAKATLTRSQEAFELTEHEYSRAKQLNSKNAMSRSEFDAAEHGYQIAQADLRTAEFAVKIAEFEIEHARAAASRYDLAGEQWGQTPFRLVSPIDGCVLRVFLEDAGAITAATPLLELGDPRDLEIEIDVLSTDAVTIQPGDKVYIEHWGGETALEAVVRIIEPSAFLKVSALGVEEKRVNVIADFVDPWSCRKTLGDGFRVEARIVVESTPEESLKIPAGCLFRDGVSWHVYRVVNGIAEQCSVEIGATNGLETHVISGLSESDVVILHPTNNVQDGVRVVANE